MHARTALSGILLVGLAASLAAQAPTTTSTQVTTMQAAPAPPSGFRAEYIAEVEDVGKKLVDLAQAMPADKYSWRPAPGVRSAGEVYVHVVNGNSNGAGLLGVPRLEGVSRDSEKSLTDKARIVDLLRKSIENVKTAAASLTDADLNRRVKAYGREMTQRQVLLHVLNHMHEHLGQSIAYARSNGVTPPWSE